MLTRRHFLQLAGGAAAALALPGCVASPPFKKDVFPDFGDPARPYLGLATSLREEHDYEAVTEGRVPRELAGTLYRIGPGLFDRGGLRKRSVLDGDGMVQSFHFHGGGVHYRNRFVRTAKFVDEEKSGSFLYPTWSTQAPGGWLANFWGPGRIKNQAGITVYLRNGRLYAFDESAFPYELDPETLATIGETRFGLPPEFTIYAAHSKIDPVTGEWLHFGLSYAREATLHVTVFAGDGTLKSHRAVALPRYVYMHDWFVSERHLIFNLHPVEISIWGVILGRRSLIDALRWRPEHGNLIMVMERGGTGAPLFMEAPPCFMWHSLNAHERGGEVIADFIGYQNPDHFIGANPISSSIMTGRPGEHAFPGQICRYLVNPAKRQVRQEKFSGGSYEWPRINELHRCHPHRFGYMAKTRPGDFFWSAICRVDMESGRMEDYDFGPGNYCSEPVFAPLPGTSYTEAGPEPGWLLSEVYQSRSRTSYLAVLRAERLADGPAALVHLTHHAPFSYHGWWSATQSA